MKILQGDAISRLRELPDESVNLCVTSPPYFGLRRYLPEDSIEHQYELGAEPLHDCLRWATVGKGWELCGQCYVCALTGVMREVRRVLRRDGVLMLNLGDSYARQAGDDSTKDPVSINTGWRRTLEGGGVPSGTNKPPPGLKPKDLVGIPWRVGLALQADGWWLRSPIVWGKGASFGVGFRDDENVLLHSLLDEAGVDIPNDPEGCKSEASGDGDGFIGNSMPGSQRDRPTLTHEHVLMLTKSEHYYWDWYAVRESSSPGSQKRIQQKTFDEQEGGGRDYGNSGSGVNPNNSARKALENWASTGGTHRQLRSVWLLNTQPCSWEFCSKCGTLYEGRERSLIRKERVEDSEGKKKVVRYCVCGASDGWVDHFAAYPPSLLEPCVRAGCPKQVCTECGEPWVRVVEKTVGTSKECPKTQAAHEARGGVGKPVGTVGKSGGGRTDPVIVTTGWQPTCDCGPDAPTRPGTVLDPFVGSGTSGLVALAEGRDFIGIDLNEDYCKVSEARLHHGLRASLPEAEL